MSDRIEQMKGKAKRAPNSSPYSLIDDSSSEVNVNRNVNVHVHKGKREKFEDRYSRATVYVENDLLEKVNQLSEGEKGEKTRIVNEALRRYLNM